MSEGASAETMSYIEPIFACSGIDVQLICVTSLMETMSLPEPLFSDSRGSFTVTLFNQVPADVDKKSKKTKPEYIDEKGLVEFCRIPRTRAEIVEYLALSSGQYALRRYLEPLVRAKVILMANPDKPRSSNQKYYTLEKIK